MGRGSNTPRHPRLLALCLQPPAAAAAAREVPPLGQQPAPRRSWDRCLGRNGPKHQAPSSRRGHPTPPLRCQHHHRLFPLCPYALKSPLARPRSSTATLWVRAWLGTPRHRIATRTNAANTLVLNGNMPCYSGSRYHADQPTTPSPICHRFPNMLFKLASGIRAMGARRACRLSPFLLTPHYPNTRRLPSATHSSHTRPEGAPLWAKPH